MHGGGVCPRSWPRSIRRTSDGGLGSPPALSKWMRQAGDGCEMSWRLAKGGRTFDRYALVSSSRPGFPMTNDPGNITLLLDQWSQGDDNAFARLMTVAYGDLRAVAHRRLMGGMHDDLATTALVHEVYLRLVRHVGGSWESRAHFYAFASRAMRNILVDHARKVNAKRRGGGAVAVEFEDHLVAGDEAVAEVIAVDEALERLASLHPRMARVVELRFFGGLVVEEVAKVLDTSVRTVEREWTRARAYLLEELSDDGS